jgi:hypothetical protein
MANAAAPKQSACLDTVIGFLLPYFAAAAADLRSARADVVETLVSYGTRTRAEFLQAAQIIALSMTTLEVLHEARTMEMSQSMRIRHRGNANSLNRAAVRTQKALDHNLTREVAEPPRPPAEPEPLDDTTDAQAQAFIDQARAAVEAYRNHFTPDATHAAAPLRCPRHHQPTDRWPGSKPRHYPPASARRQPLNPPAHPAAAVPPSDRARQRSS